MAYGIRTGDPRGFNNGRSSKFRERSRVRQTPKEGWRTYRPKRCGNNNKDEDNSPKTLNDKNQQASSQKFKQLIPLFDVLIIRVPFFLINVFINIQPLSYCSRLLVCLSLSLYIYIYIYKFRDERESVCMSDREKERVRG